MRTETKHEFCKPSLRAACPGGRCRTPAYRAALRRGRGVRGRADAPAARRQRGLRHAVAGGGRAHGARRREAHLRHGQRLRGQRRRGRRRRLRTRAAQDGRGRGDRVRPGPDSHAAAGRAGAGDSREHPGQLPELRRCLRLLRHGRDPRGAGEGDVPCGDPGAEKAHPGGAGAGGLRPRRDVHVLLRAVHDQRLPRLPQRQQGRLRPVLPLDIPPDGGEASRRILPRGGGRARHDHPLLLRHELPGLSGSDHGRGRDLLQAGGPHEVALLRGHRDQRLPQAHRRHSGRQRGHSAGGAVAA